MADTCSIQACSTGKVYPKAVVSSVRQQLKSLQLEPPQKEQPLEVPSRMELDECLKVANLRDAAMVELLIPTDTTKKVVKEVDVLRSREMIQNNTGKYGSICFVVRRPG